MAEDPTDKLFRELDQEFPKFKFVYKDESWLMKAVDVFLKVVSFGMMRTFMTRFATVIGYTMYVSRSGWYDLSPVGRAVVMRHERVHMRQRRRYGFFLYSLLYLFVPLPLGLSYFRMKFEREAYEESILAAVELGLNSKGERFRSSVVQAFVGPSYLWTWPFRKEIETWYDEAAVKAMAKAFVSRTP
jgi:hypothetical protein